MPGKPRSRRPARRALHNLRYWQAREYLGLGPGAAWRERGLLVRGAGRARLTEAGFLLSDALFVELL